MILKDFKKFFPNIICKTRSLDQILSLLSSSLQTLVSTRWQGYEVMCHVATLLPYSPSDEQMVQKKRHIGNDLVCIIFLEGDAVFSPRAVKSQYIHVFIVVKVLYGNDSSVPVSWSL